MPIYDFADALKADDAGKRNLLLGNGFSIALRPKIFTYSSIYEEADFERLPYAESLFEAAGTYDFETVIGLLVFAQKAAEIFNQDPKFIRRINRYVNRLRDLLVETLSANHPNRPYDIDESNFKSVRYFLNHFDKLYTLNYDLLLYWSMHQSGLDKYKYPKGDGFSDPIDGENEGYCQWLPGNSSAEMYFLHGALHLVDAPSGILKYTYSKTSKALMDQMRASLEDEKYPLFVSEGASASKFEKIMHNGYLSRAYESFSKSCFANKNGSFWIYGHSLAGSDDHIFRCIKEGTVPRLWVSLKSDDAKKEDVKNRANLIAAARPDKHPLDVRFFDADSAEVWSKYDSSHEAGKTLRPRRAP